MSFNFEGGTVVVAAGDGESPNDLLAETYDDCYGCGYGFASSGCGTGDGWGYGCGAFGDGNGSGCNTIPDHNERICDGEGVGEDAEHHVERML